MKDLLHVMPFFLLNLQTAVKGCARRESPCGLCGRAGEQNDQSTMQVGVLLNQPLSSWENFL